MSTYRLPIVLASLALIAVACSSGAGASAPPSTGTAGTPEPSGVDFPTGATDVVLRLEEGGGFVPVEFAAAQAPVFTLYGDGRVVFQPKTEMFPEPDAAGIIRMKPWRIAQLDAGQMEELLTFALGQGGLGAARENYSNDMVMDAGTSTFTINAGGVKKTVAVYALGMEGAPDEVARKAFMLLADRLRDFDNGGTIGSDVYAPTAYRAVLIEREGIEGTNPIPWPWPDLSPADFMEGDGVTAPTFPHRVLTADEVAALNLGDVSGGMQGPVLAAPNDKFYSFILRPLLPDET